MRVGALAFAVCLALSHSAASAAESFRQLRGIDIKARFVGREFTDEVHWALVFGRDGSLSSFEMGAAGKGTWKVEKDELCMTYAREARRCYQVWVSGKSVQLRSEGRLPEDGVLQAPAPRKAH